MVHPLSMPQGGQGSIEFVLAAVPLLLLGLGSLEAVHWHYTRQAVSLALAQAARAAITQHADPVALDHAFMQALLPLHAAPSLHETRARLERNMQRRTQATGLPAWRIEILSPSGATFRDFASRDPELARYDALETIDNDYLQEQHEARMADGWVHGRGPISRQTTLEANVLVLHLTWLHEPLLPGVSNLLRQLAPPDTRYGSQAMARGGYLPIRREVAFVMQSHAVAWPMPAHGRVQRSLGPGANTGLAYSNTTGFEGPHPCTGLWCLDTVHPARLPSHEGMAPSAPEGASHGALNEPEKSGTDMGKNTPDGEPVDYREPAAGAPGETAPPEEGEPNDCPGCCD